MAAKSKRAKKHRNATKSGTTAVQPFPLPDLPRLNPDAWFWLLLAIGAMMRLAIMGRHGFYYDEVLNLLDARQSYSHILFRKVHPLHLLMLRPAALYSGSEWALRIVPAVFGLAGTVFMFWIGRMLAGQFLARTLAAVWIASEYALFYSTDANYYGEMMFYSLLSLWGAMAFVKYGRWWGLILMLGSSACNFAVHPFSGLFSGLLLLAIIADAGIVSSSRALLLRKERYWQAGKPTLAAIMPALILIGTLAGLMFVGGRVWSQARFFLRNFKFGAWAHNLDLNLYFFASAFRSYVPSLIIENGFSWFAAALAFALFAYGIIWIARFRPALAVLILIPMALTFFFIFNTGISRFYHIRYTSYLSPLFLIGVGVGLVKVGEWLQSRFNHKFKSISTRGIFAAAGVSLLFAPFSIHLILRDYSNWKGVQREIENSFSSDSRLYVFNAFDHYMASHYIERAGFVKDQLVFTKHHHGPTRPMALQELKTTVFNHPDSWFVSHWTEDGTVHQPMLDWVKRHFELVLDKPSRHEVSLIQQYDRSKRRAQLQSAPHQSATLYRWNYPHTFLLFPFDLTIPLSLCNSSGNRISCQTLDAKSATGDPMLEVRITLLVDRAREYTVELNSAPASGSASTIEVNGQTFDMVERNGRLTSDVSLDSGPVDLTMTIAPMTPISDWDQLEVRIYPRLDEGIVIPGLAYVAIQPGSDMRVGSTPFGHSITLQRNGFVQYPFYVSDNARYGISVHAVNDAPAPVLLEAWINDKPEAILSFNQGDDQIGARRLEMMLTPGRHNLSLFFLNETADDKAPAPSNRDATIAAIEVRPLEADHPSGDDREHDLSRNLIPPPAMAQNGLLPLTTSSDTTTLPRNWNMQIDPQDKYKITQSDSDDVLTLTMAPESKGGAILSPAIPVNGGKFFLASIDLRCRNLLNHSANLLILSVDSTGRPISQNLMYTQGITADSDWVTFTGFLPVPHDATAVLFGVSIYNNSKTTYLEQEEVSVRRFLIHELD